MNTNHAQDFGEPRIQWYARSEVDTFVERAQQQRAELEEQIEQANARAERARTAAGLHRVMATMVLDSQRALAARRREAEQQAMAIVASVGAAPTGTPAPTGVPATIDLVAATNGASTDPAIQLAPPASLANGRESEPEDGDAAFLAFLREGLSEGSVDPSPTEREHL